MTRRCSVMRMPVAAQRASIPVALSMGLDLNTVISGIAKGGSGDSVPIFATFAAVPIITRSAIAQMSGQVTPHQERIQGFAAALPVIALTASDNAKSGTFIKPARRLVIFFHFQKYCPDAPARQMAQMGQQ